MKQKFKPIINHLYDPDGCQLYGQLRYQLVNQLYCQLSSPLRDQLYRQLYVKLRWQLSNWLEGQIQEVIKNETEV